jgi:hypothetical protein
MRCFSNRSITMLASRGHSYSIHMSGGRRPMKIIYSYEFQQLKHPDQYFSLARGYLEGSRVLCAAMCNDDYAPQYPHTRVILHLCRHAVELFFKGAILSKSTNGKPPGGHNLAKLATEYERVFPNQEFRFEVPFGFETLGPFDLSPELAEIHRISSEYHHKMLDQRYRYPADSNMKPFSEAESFIPATFMSNLNGLSKAFLRIEMLLQGTGS